MALIFFVWSCRNSEENSRPERNARFEEKDCQFDDGNYSAEVEYNNAETGYSATYTLNVQVEECQVVKIDFPNGGYLDNDHIEPEPIDEDGDASITDDRGRTFDVHIEKPESDSEPDDHN